MKYLIDSLDMNDFVFSEINKKTIVYLKLFNFEETRD